MDIHESLNRVLEKKQNLVDRFYRTFLDRHPEARSYFRGVDLQHQAELLRMALIMIEAHYTHSYPAIASYLRSLGGKHKRRGIPDGLFPEFRDALLATLEALHGPAWEPRLAGQWRQAFDHAMAAMQRGYEDPFPA